MSYCPFPCMPALHTRCRRIWRGVYRLAAGWSFLSDGRKYYTAIVQNIHYSAPAGYEVKEVSALLDAHPILLPEQFRFWDWLADYYLCTRGDVYKAALPSGLSWRARPSWSITPISNRMCNCPKRNRRYWTCLPRSRNSAYETGEGERHQEYPVCN